MTAKRNAEAGSQISRSLDGLAAVMAQPVIISSNDTTYLEKAITVLNNDKTLIPQGAQRSRMYAKLVEHLSNHPGAACTLVLTTDTEFRRGLVEGYLNDEGFEFGAEIV